MIYCTMTFKIFVGANFEVENFYSGRFLLENRFPVCSENDLLRITLKIFAGANFRMWNFYRLARTWVPGVQRWTLLTRKIVLSSSLTLRLYWKGKFNREIQQNYTFLVPVKIFCSIITLKIITNAKICMWTLLRN